MNAQKYPLKYSQNFLNSKNTIKKLLSIANISKSDIIYEIGAGKGAITKELAYLCREVHAIEYDIELHEYLRNNVNHKNIRHICIDVLDYKFPDSGDFKVVSNIPYTITSAILDKLLFSRNPPVDSYVIIQKEAALRYSGSPYKNDTLKSLMLKPFFLFEILYELKRSNFYPPPVVDSVFLRIKKHNNILINGKYKNLYYDFLTYIFQNRSGSIKNRFSSIFTNRQLEKLSSDYFINLHSGINELKYQQWISLFFYFLYTAPKEKSELIKYSYSSYKDAQFKLEKIHRNRKE